MTGIHVDMAAWLKVQLTEREERLSFNPSAAVRREVLADCDSKRLIIDWCLEVIGDRDLSGYGTPGFLKDDPNALAVTLAMETLRALTLALQERPGYLAEWRRTP